MSYYPDRTSRYQSQVVVLQTQRLVDRVSLRDVKRIVCLRKVHDTEQFLVKWKNKSQIRPYSWHDLDELSECLTKVQQYLDSHHSNRLQSDFRSLLTVEHKRKRLNSDDCYSSSSSNPSRTSPAPSSSTVLLGERNDSTASEPDVYYGTLRRHNGRITIDQTSEDIRNAEPVKLPTAHMLQRASITDARQAANVIRLQFCSRLAEVQGPKVSLVNLEDESSPSLAFNFVNECIIHQSIIAKGVKLNDSNFYVGCGSTRVRGQSCRPDMGQMMGCEYSKVCECLEFAAVDESSLKDDEKAMLARGDTMGLRKKFPYFSILSTRRPECLVSFYLESRHPIYECNPLCKCGPNCKTRVVQKGRTVPLEIFKTSNRGWGLRCTEDLMEGQFIDTYRGEIITNQEADRREKKASKGKALSYLYNLDKHVEPGVLNEEDCYVVDGESYGGPTRFMNHSCEPNCRQYTVSYNKYDIQKYELAFFAYMAIPAGTELTFDYLDKDDIEEEEDSKNPPEDREGYMKCKCGSKRCRGRLWV